MRPRGVSGAVAMVPSRGDLWLLGVCAAITACAASVGAADVQFVKRDDGAYVVTARTYTAVVDGEGNFRSLKIGAAEFFNDTAPFKGGAFPAKEPAETVNLYGNVIAARRGDVRVEYAFDETGIKVLTEGGSVEYRLSKNVTAAIARDGNTQDLSGAGGGIIKIVAGDAAFGIDPPFHKHLDRLLPSHLTQGGSPTKLFEYRIECGISASAEELISAIDLVAVGKNVFKVPDYTPGEAAVFEISMRDLGRAAVAAETVCTLKDHWVDGKVVAEKTMPAAFEGGAEVKQRFEAQLPAPGFYWLYVELLKDGKALKRVQMGFIYDGAHYKPPLTRPKDFGEFWKGKLAAMRALPFAPTLTEVPDKSTDAAIHYDLELAIAGGKRLKTALQVPRKPGKYVGQFGCGEKATNDARVCIDMPLPEMATFSRWVSRDDNNMLDCYLLAVRLTDYLRARPDVDRIFLFGASRTGPIQFANAALDPTRVAGVDIHVPTSAGISWPDKVYRGWGGRPRDVPQDKWLEMSAYFDPVNFAPDMTVPFIVTGGIGDDLAPAPGILAMFNWAEKSLWKRCSIERGGHQYFPAHKQFQQELQSYLGSGTREGTDEKILKEH